MLCLKQYLLCTVESLQIVLNIFRCHKIIKVMELEYHSIANSAEFVCMKENIEPDEYIEIQENDIIGACIKRGYLVAQKI